MKIKTPNPEILLEAAQNIEDGKHSFSCNAVSHVSRIWYPPSPDCYHKSNARKWYERLYEIDTNTLRFFDNEEQRVLALLFAYQIALDEKGQFEMPVDETEVKINQIVKIGADLGLNCVILRNFIQSQIRNDDGIAEGHNPQSLTNKQVEIKDGWRLLTIEEIRFRMKLSDIGGETNIEMAHMYQNEFDCWGKNACGNVLYYAYRTKTPKDYFLSNVK